MQLSRTNSADLLQRTTDRQTHGATSRYRRAGGRTLWRCTGRGESPAAPHQGAPRGVAGCIGPRRGPRSVQSCDRTGPAAGPSGARREAALGPQQVASGAKGPRRSSPAARNITQPRFLSAARPATQRLSEEGPPPRSGGRGARGGGSSWEPDPTLPAALSLCRKETRAGWIKGVHGSRDLRGGEGRTDPARASRDGHWLRGAQTKTNGGGGVIRAGRSADNKNTKTQNQARCCWRSPAAPDSKQRRGRQRLVVAIITVV